MPNPKTTPPGDEAAVLSSVRSAAIRLNSLRTTMEAYSVPAVGTVADLRTLGASATTDEVRQCVITLIRDLQEI